MNPLQAIRESVLPLFQWQEATDALLHIAEMMIKGNTMGVNKMAQHLRDYDRTDPNVTLLAKKMLDVEQAHIGELRSFL